MSKIACSFDELKKHEFLVNQKIFPTKKEIQFVAKKVYCKKYFPQKKKFSLTPKKYIVKNYLAVGY